MLCPTGPQSSHFDTIQQKLLTGTAETSCWHKLLRQAADTNYCHKLLTQTTDTSF